MSDSNTKDVSGADIEPKLDDIWAARMKQALATPSVMVPQGLTPEQIRDFILQHATSDMRSK